MDISQLLLLLFVILSVLVSLAALIQTKQILGLNKSSRENNLELKKQLDQIISTQSDAVRLQEQFKQQQENLEKNQNRIEQALRQELKDEMATNREAALNQNSQLQGLLTNNSKQSREELSQSLRDFANALTTNMRDLSNLQKSQLEIFSKQLKDITEGSHTNLTQMRNTIEERLKILQDDNNKKLEQMRATVDEKLQSTLERRLGESFKLVTDKLEAVHKGFGEMQSLAAGVGDLKKVLTNVKTRGTWGEVQLSNLLEQLLTKEQYSENIATKKNSKDRVEFAINLPGRDDDSLVYLPIDAKFPQEDYQRLLEAQELGDKLMAEQASKQLVLRIKSEAKDIQTKYIDPPNTTDFGIMFLPTEGLYAEVLRQAGLLEILQREHRIVVAGPTTLAALLNSLQMGFRTLAIQKRSSEVWNILATVKTEFSKFGDILEKTKKKLQEASNHIDTASSKSRTIERKLRNVEMDVDDEPLALIEEESDLLLNN